MNDADPVFELRDVVKRYGDTVAVAGVDLTVRRGERVALAGPSGAGKTTLIGLLNGSLSPTSGTVKAFGRDLSSLPPANLRRIQRRIGTVHQQFHLVGNLKVVHNVNAGRLGEWSFLKSLLSLVRPAETERAAEALERVGIRNKLYERTERLSGGEQQRVAIGRVLAQDPEAILADEPIASLDRENSRQVMDLLRDLSRESGKTAVMSLHDVNYALSHCERVVGLRKGRVLFDSPASRVTSDMLGRLYSLEELEIWYGEDGPGD